MSLRNQERTERQEPDPGPAPARWAFPQEQHAPERDEHNMQREQCRHIPRDPQAERGEAEHRRAAADQADQEQPAPGRRAWVISRWGRRTTTGKSSSVTRI